MNPPCTDIATDVCYRCGYDLRATPDDRPCPECGLLAARSRRPSDELRYSRPRWLRGLAWGTALVLTSILVAWLWAAISAAFLQPRDSIKDGEWFIRVVAGGEAVAMAMLVAGAVLLTRKERYPPADRADRWLRFFLRLASLIPLAAAGLVIAYTLVHIRRSFVVRPRMPLLGQPRTITYSVAVKGILTAAAYVGVIGSIPLPLLLFMRLRGLAKRARSAHLAEHCLIVGIGGSGSLLLFAIMEQLSASLAVGWTWDSTLFFVLMAAATVGPVLMALWSIYLLIRFTISFMIAARAVWRDQASA